MIDQLLSWDNIRACLFLCSSIIILNITQMYTHVFFDVELYVVYYVMFTAYQSKYFIHCI